MPVLHTTYIEMSSERKIEQGVLYTSWIDRAGYGIFFYLATK